MAKAIPKKILHFIQTVDLAEFDDGVFNKLALELFARQFAQNAIYRGVCLQQKTTPDQLDGWREIPAVTTSAFKAVPLTCFPANTAAAVFHTSGTTQSRPGKHYFRTLDFYRAAMLRSFAAHCLDPQLDAAPGVNTKTVHAPSKAVIPEKSFFDSKQSLENKKDSSEMTFPFAVARNAKMRMLFLGPTAEHFPHSSLGYMFSEIRDEFGDEKSAVFFSPHGVEVDAFRAALEQASQEHTPVFILGTALALLECMEKFAEQGRTFHLPPGSRILDTGGYKSRHVAVTREEFQQRLSASFGVPPEYLLNEYGMTELSSQFYASRLLGVPLGGGQFHGTEHPLPSALRPQHFSPPWVRVAAADPETLKILPEGEVGLLRIFDLANVDSVLAIQTEDLGRARQDRIELLGRATGAELRGCSLLTETIVKST
jgi:hypothetical protein